MTDERLDEALRALRADALGDSPDAETTLRRVLATTRAEAQRTRRAWTYLLPIAAVLVATSSWAAATGRIASIWPSAPAPSPVAMNAPPEPGDVAPLAGASGTPGADAPARDDLADATAAPTDDAPSSSVEIAAAATSTPSRGVDADRSPQLGASRGSRPATAAKAPPSTPIAAASARPARDASPAADALAEDKADFQAAYRVYGSGAPSAAVDAWNGYLAKHPTGRFVPEARYARAVALVRSGQRAAARDALRPFAEAKPGAYRRDDAQRLLETLGEK